MTSIDSPIGKRKRAQVITADHLLILCVSKLHFDCSFVKMILLHTPLQNFVH